MTYPVRYLKGSGVFERLRKNIDDLVDKVTKVNLKSEKLDPILEEFKLTLLEDDVALSVADRICEELKTRLQGATVDRFEDLRGVVKETLRTTLTNLFDTAQKIDLLALMKRKVELKAPTVIVFVGINGTGKTTTIAKVARLLMNHGYSTVLACSDTYRAGAIEQLDEHANRLGTRMIKRPYGADAASVGFDAISHAKAHGINAVLIDTAGRMETDVNLMNEMQKIVRVTQPDLVLFVGDALTGNDAVAQAEEFDKRVNISASILTKIDADVKGGTAISVAYTTKKPIIFLGNGQRYEDLIPFDPKFIVDRILGD
jgi:fused signal recognition particle receptor